MMAIGHHSINNNKMELSELFVCAGAHKYILWLKVDFFSHSLIEKHSYRNKKETRRKIKVSAEIWHWFRSLQIFFMMLARIFLVCVFLCLNFISVFALIQFTLLCVCVFFFACKFYRISAFLLWKLTAN